MKDRLVVIEPPDVDMLKVERDQLIQQRDSLKDEIVKIRSVFEVELSQRMGKARQEETRVAEEGRKLETAKREFEDALVQYKKDKNSLDKEKSEIVGLRQVTTESRAKISRFIQTVRKESELL